jgi:hypothetical protein
MFQEKFFVMPALNDATDRNMARGLSLALERKKETEMAERAKSAQRTEVDIASERMGRNQLQGDDQSNVHNERQAVPDVKQETDEVIESFEKLDKDQRAKSDLGKGNRSGE